MEHLIGQILSGTHGAVAYGLVFLILILCGLGLPLPEDVSLILGGYLAYSGAVKIEAMVAVGFLGILCGDSIIFFAGRRLGRNIKPGSWFGRIVTPAKRQKVERKFAGHGEKIVMAARFLPGVRAVTYFTAGTAGLSYPRFIFFDGLAACVSAPVFVLGGRYFGGEITHFIHLARRAQGLVFAAALGLVVAYYFVERWRTRDEELAVEEGAADPAERGEALPRSEPAADVAPASIAPAQDGIRLAK